MMCRGFVRRGFTGRARANSHLGINAPHKGAAASEGKANAGYFCLILEGGQRVCAGGEEYSLKELLERTEVCLA